MLRGEGAVDDDAGLGLGDGPQQGFRGGGPAQARKPMLRGLLGGEVGSDDGAEDNQEHDAEAHDGDLGFGVGPAGELPEGWNGLEVLALGRE